jgi:Effector Associated Constant Component 1
MGDGPVDETERPGGAGKPGVQLAVAGEAPISESQSLVTWLDGEPDLGGRIRVHEGAAAPESLGVLSVLLDILLDSGAMGSALAAPLVAWIRRRVGSVSVHVKRADGAEFSLTADHIRPLSNDDTRALITQLASFLDQESA